MKKLTALVLALMLVLSCVSALADYAGATSLTSGYFTENRNITIKPAGENTVADGISPVTGLPLAQQAARAQDGFLGMAITNEYSPVMVQHCGYAGAVGPGAPFYGSYADVYYELAKSLTGHTRLCMIFNDIHPTYVGASRSTRVGYIWIRQEWGCPYLYAGKQDQSWPGKWNTKVSDAITALKIPSSYSADTPAEQRVLFDGTDGGSKPWLSAKRRVEGKGMVNADNLVWDLPYLDQNVFGEGRTYNNHTWKFADALPENGDNANLVYVMFKNNAAEQKNTNAPSYYYNSFFEYEPEENVYYRYVITDLDKPLENPIPFTEQVFSNVVTKGNVASGEGTLSGDRVEGDPITFANVIIQFTENKWPAGECPYPILTGEGNADYFMGGKHLKGVWKRDTYEDRTVFYGEDGEEIALQPGRTYIVVMDYGEAETTKAREIRYE